MLVQKTTKNILERPTLAPYQQGAFDALCGVYSIVNAIQWVCKDEKPLSKYRAGQIAEYGLSSLIRKGLLNQVVIDGMSNRLWRSLMRKMTEFANNRYGYELAIYAVDQQILLEEALSEILVGSNVLLIHLKGAFNHYTVITAYQGKRWILYDSDGMKYIQQSSVKASFERKSSRYRFARNGVFLLSPK